MKMLSLISCLAFIAFQNSPAKSNQPFMIGVLQANGALIPFASYDGAKWSNSWPGSDEQGDVKVDSLSKLPKAWTGGVPLPETWRLWLPTDTSYFLKVLGTAYVKSECADHWSLTVDFPKQATGCSNCCPVPTIGIALSSDRLVMPMTEAEVDPSMRIALQAAFNGLETSEITRTSALYGAPGGRLPYSGHPIDAAVRNSSAIAVENAWRGEPLNDGDDSLYYIEAKREYSKPAGFNDSGCPGVSAFRGWFRTNPSRKIAVIDQRLVIEDCDMKTAGFTRPVGLIEVNGVNHAIVQTSGWESQNYGILRIEQTAARTLVTTSIH